VIGLITTNYWPEPTGIAVYTQDLAEKLNHENLNCSVLTSLPHYPWWRVPNEYADQNEGFHVINDVEVLRVKHYIPKNFNVFSRFRFEFSLYINLKRMSKKFGNPTTLIACIPTLASLYVALSLKKQSRSPVGVIVQDLSGKGASQSGQFGGSLIAMLAEYVEIRALKKADLIVVVSESMKFILKKQGIPESKITLISNYSVRKPHQIDKIEARKSLGWSEKNFIAIHTGNIGAKQDLGNLVEAAKFLPNKTCIKIIGHGNQEKILKEKALKVLNIEVLPAVSDDEYSNLLSAADLLLVNERSTQMEMSLPSKLTSYLFSERPVLAAVPHGGATWRFLDGVAELVEAGDPIALARKIEELSRQPEKLKDLALRGKVFAEENLSAEVGRKKYLDWVEELISLGKNRL